MVKSLYLNSDMAFGVNLNGPARDFQIIKFVGGKVTGSHNNLKLGGRRRRGGRWENGKREA